MAGLRETVPSEFADDERWYKYFTKKSLFTLVAGAAFAYVMTALFRMVGLTIVGFIIGAIVAGAAFLAVVVRWPVEDTIHGGGASLDVLLFRVIARKRERTVLIRKEG